VHDECTAVDFGSFTTELRFAVKIN